jgi:UPF0755 protein
MAEKHAKAAKRPRKRKKIGPILFVLFLIIAVIVGAAVLALRQEINGAGANGQTVTVEIEQGSGVATIASRLQESGMIRFPEIFRWYVKREGVANKLQYGSFTMVEGWSYDEIIRTLSQYTAAATTRVTFPEGSTAIAIAQKMEQAGLCTAEEFLDVANNGDFSQFRFWQYLPTDKEAPNRFMKCEGYLFPDTYEFFDDGYVYDYVATFYARFDEMLTDEMYAEMEQQGMTLQELITLASFVQEEAGNSQNSNVAQVFRNRLAEGSPYPRLESNACSYIQNDEENNYLWNWVAPYYGGWDNIPEAMLEAYDTYQCTGLPAGPISNPGIEEIKAALSPTPDAEVEDCYFFVTDLTGKYYYGRTLAEHNDNCATARAVNKTLQ